MPLTGHPLHRSGRAALPHPAPTLGANAKRWSGNGKQMRGTGNGSPPIRHTGLEEAEEPGVVERVEPRLSASSTQFTFAVNRCCRSRLAACRTRPRPIDACPALRPGVVVVVRVPLGPPASLDRLRGRLPGVVRRRPRYYQAVRRLAVVHHRRTSLDPRCARRRSRPPRTTRPPGSQTRCFRACSGSTTARGPITSRTSGARDVAFRFFPQRRHPGVA